MKALIALAAAMTLAGCATTNTSSSHSADEPIVSNYGTYSRDSMEKVACGDGFVHITLNNQLVKVPESAFSGAWADQANVAALQASPNLNSLGCAQNPFPAKSVSLSIGIPAAERDYRDPAWILQPNDGFLTNSAYASAITQLLNSSKCIEQYRISYCPTIEQEFSDSDEDGNFFHVRTFTESIALQSGVPFTARCQESFSNPACRITDTGSENIAIQFLYFDKTPRGHRKGVEIYEETVGQVRALIQ